MSEAPDLPPEPLEAADISAANALSALARGLAKATAHPEDLRLCARTAQLIATAMANGRYRASMRSDQSGDMPPPEQWRSILYRCNLLTENPNDPQHRLFCTLPEDGITFSGLYRRQQRIAERLQQLATLSDDMAADDAAEMLERYFPQKAFSRLQRLAAGTALFSGLTLITGGPGTGKTHVIRRLAAMLVERFGDSSTVALAAFTGRAASQMAQSGQTGELVLPDLSDRCSTLHRLLGFRPGGFPGKQQSLPTGLRALIVDEASMIGLELLDELLQAIPPKCRLILVGDANQLPSIELGGSFAELCHASSPPEALDSRLAQAGLEPEHSEAGTDRPQVLQRLVRLKKTHRVDKTSALAELGRLVLEDPEGAMRRIEEAKNAPPDAEIRWLPIPDFPSGIVGELARPWLNMPLPETPEQALQMLSKARILSARRTGLWGVESLNRQLSGLLAQRNITEEAGELWPLHCPILIDRNDYDAGLYNGDMGVVLRRPDGEVAVCFPGDGDGVRYHPPALLPPHSRGWAVTVHKSQGSEYDQVAVVLSDSRHPWPRALAYTAFTRARRQLLIVADRDNLNRTLTRTDEIPDGLRFFLHGAND